MELEVMVEWNEDLEEYLAEVVGPECKYRRLAGWGSTEEAALQDLHNGVRYLAMLSQSS